MSILSTITVRNFRCFGNESFNFDAPTVIIIGENGTGKTSLLEAIFYATSLRSFKTRTPRDCIAWENDGLLIGLAGNTTMHESWDLRVCVTMNGERTVKLNGKMVHSWHEIVEQCRSITISEEDLSLVGGAPEDRRRFIDHIISLENPEYLKRLVVLRRIVRQKNALLASGRCTLDTFASWTSQLNELSTQIREARKIFISQLQVTINEQVTRHRIAPRVDISLTYKGENSAENLSVEELFLRESTTHRTLAGAHLDDLNITYNGKSARQFASRGQQKLIAFLLKTSAIKLLSQPALILVDDFMTDFDEKNAAILLELAQNLGGQLIITAPQPGCLPTKLLDQIELKVYLSTKNFAYCQKELKTTETT